MKHFFLGFFLAASLLLGGCRKHVPHSVTHGFYYWKTDFNLDDQKDTAAFRKLGVKKLYVKFFDVDWNRLDGPYPLAITNFRENNYYEKVLDGGQVVPVVFITNNTLLKTDSAGIKDLAGKIYRKVNSFKDPQFLINTGKTLLANELQIDCDWSASTKDKYFLLLRSIKKLDSNLLLTATVRLYQLAYPKKVGIPPVDRAMLMFYNMGDFKNASAANSILDLNEAKKYMKEAGKYPVKMDVVLPLFSWGAVFRYGKFYVLLHEMNENEAKNLPFLKKGIGNLYTCQADTVYRKTYLRKGDEIRIEQPSMADLDEAAKITSEYIKNDSVTVSFFSWDKTYINTYGIEKLEDIYHSYR